MLSDVQHVILIRADFSDKTNIKGTVVFKCAYRAVLGVYSERKDPRRVNLILLKDSFQTSLQANPYAQ